ncbi:MAG: glycosyltransferase [Lachnospiraceae bacterium]|nr:glycosyltransferase [Lachnospiraceae bacterium]
MRKISFVIPCYRSENTVRSVYEEIREVIGQKTDYCYEIIAVNDCSPDNVLQVLVSIADEDQNVKVVDCAKNMGKHAALMAGFHFVSGEIVVCVDDDFQCPMDQLWRLLEPLNAGYDVSMAKYGRKAQSSLKNVGSLGNELMMRWMLGKPRDFQFTNFAAMKRFVVEEMTRYDNAYSYVNGLVLRSTSKYVNVPMEERERLSGTGGYTFKKSLLLWVNGLTAFSVLPLRLATILGLICTVFGLALGIICIVRAVLGALQIIAPGLAAVFFVGGLLMLLIGLLGEYVGRIYMCINKAPQYVIRRTWNIQGTEEDA